jgi:hypothetical protein
MLGLGLNGLWVSRYGTFGPRRLKDDTGGGVGGADDTGGSPDSD